MDGLKAFKRSHICNHICERLQAAYGPVQTFSPKKTKTPSPQSSLFGLARLGLQASHNSDEDDGGFGNETEEPVVNDGAHVDADDD